MKRQIEKVREEFTKQAGGFNDYQKSFSQEARDHRLIDSIGFASEEIVLEVAAGTCAFGRTIAPHVKRIVELDATEAMLEVGKREGERAGIRNAAYSIGLAEGLPFPDESFDVVVSRLAFHHFADASAPFCEMCRVLKPGGKLVIVDMEARTGSLRDIADSIERLRDPSHARCLSRAEFLQLVKENGMAITYCETTPRPVSMDAWMDLTKVPEETREVIRAAIARDMSGGEKTGLEPYEKEGLIMFDHLWLEMIARKAST